MLEFAAEVCGKSLLTGCPDRRGQQGLTEGPKPVSLVRAPEKREMKRKKADPEVVTDSFLPGELLLFIPFVEP